MIFFVSAVFALCMHFGISHSQFLDFGEETSTTVQPFIKPQPTLGPDAKELLARRVGSLEDELNSFARGKTVPSQVALEYKVDVGAISGEAKHLLDKYGESLQFHELQSLLQGTWSGGAWTCLSLHATKGNMCSDANEHGYAQTLAWNDAPVIRQLLDPIKPSLERVKLSRMHPDTLVIWHCDDCPSEEYFRINPEPAEVLVKKVGHRFHQWVRLHLILSDNNEYEMDWGGGQQVHGASSGSFYLANVALPHRLDNKGSSTRTILLIDVRVNGHEKMLKQSPLGQSILKAAKAAKAANGAVTYLKMAQAIMNYRNGLSWLELYEAEQHYYAWKRPLWRPSPPLQLDAFNSPTRCGLFGPIKSRGRVDMLFGANDTHDSAEGDQQSLSNIIVQSARSNDNIRYVDLATAKLRNAMSKGSQHHSQNIFEPKATYWRCKPENGLGIHPRIEPQIDAAPLLLHIMPGTLVKVSKEQKGADGVLFLQLADSGGWVFDTVPGVGTMCVRAGLKHHPKHHSGHRPSSLLRRLRLSSLEM